jgi:hypothetical protein
MGPQQLRQHKQTQELQQQQQHADDDASGSHGSGAGQGLGVVVSPAADSAALDPASPPASLSGSASASDLDSDFPVHTAHSPVSVSASPSLSQHGTARETDDAGSVNSTTPILMQSQRLSTPPQSSSPVSGPLAPPLPRLGLGMAAAPSGAVIAEGTAVGVLESIVEGDADV